VAAAVPVAGGLARLAGRLGGGGGGRGRRGGGVGRGAGKWQKWVPDQPRNISPPQIRVQNQRKLVQIVPLFNFLALLRKIFISSSFLERFQKMDPELGAVDHGAELTCLGATDHGAEVLGLKTVSVTLL
jgi:hypothetical protein